MSPRNQHGAGGMADFSQYRVEPGTHIRLRDIDTSETGQYSGKHQVDGALAAQHDRIETFQERLYAENRRSLLIIFQATDTGGKDGVIRHVFQGVNPQGCQVWSFKQPSSDELEHDFLWRYHARTPGRGMIGIFNRSQYEDVLIVRVHNLVPENVWRPRYATINDFERMLALNGTVILKFYLHISRDEQKRRLQARLDAPDKRWKFNIGDLEERTLWDDYQAAFEDAINACSTEYAPWYVIPANKKWYRDLVVAHVIADTLEALNPQFPAEKDLDPSTITIPD